MITATILDPSLFAGLDPQDLAMNSLMKDHLFRMAHSHLLVLDSEDVLGDAIKEVVSRMPLAIRVRIEAALTSNSQRIVRIEMSADATDRQKLCTQLLGRPGASIAFAINRPDVDALITDKDGKDYSDHFDSAGAANVFTLPEYYESPTYGRSLGSMGAASTRRMTASDFCKRIVAPVVRWAKSVNVIDPHIIEAMYEHNPDGTGRRDAQWPRYLRTLRALYDQWNETVAVKPKEFIVWTRDYGPPSRWRKLRENMQELQPEYPSAEKQAKDLAEKLDLGKHMRIHVMGYDPNLSDVAHDRYLTTDRDIVLSFSRGFDLISPKNDILIESLISLCQRDAPPSVDRLTKAQNVQATCLLSGIDGWRSVQGYLEHA